MVVQYHTPYLLQKFNRMYKTCKKIILNIVLFFTSSIYQKRKKYDHIRVIRPPAQKAQIPMCKGG